MICTPRQNNWAVQPVFVHGHMNRVAMRFKWLGTETWVMPSRTGDCYRIICFLSVNMLVLQYNLPQVDWISYFQCYCMYGSDQQCGVNGNVNRAWAYVLLFGTLLTAVPCLHGTSACMMPFISMIGWWCPVVHGWLQTGICSWLKS